MRAVLAFTSSSTTKIRPLRDMSRVYSEIHASLESDSLAWLRREAFGFIFQSYNLLARTSAIENVALPLFYAAAGASSGAERTELARAVLIECVS